jgi:hypothetical protein
METVKATREFAAGLVGDSTTTKRGDGFSKAKGSGFLIPMRLMDFFTSICAMAMGFTQVLTETRTSGLLREQSAAGE